MTEGFLAGCAAMVLVLFIVVGGIGLAVGGYIFKWYTLPFQGAMQAREQIQGSGAFRIQAYTKFYNDCAAIQVVESDLEAQTGLLERTTTDYEKRIIDQNVTALTADRLGRIRRYNQDSHKQWTEAQFKSEYLPYEIPATPWRKGATTQCAI